MTKQEQNAIIMSSIAAKLVDTPDVADKLDTVFATWFQALAQAGLQALAPVATEEAAVPAEGEQ